MNKKLRPCDCVDAAAASQLNEQGIKLNNNGISVISGRVLFELDSVTVLMPMNRFKMFAEWYLTEQEIDD